MREEGFYWVRHCCGWEVAKWVEVDGWTLPGDGMSCDGSSFYEIDERRIERQAP